MMDEHETPTREPSSESRRLSQTMPEFLPASARRSWAHLGTATDADGAVFDPDRVSTLPVPVARWLRHAIAPGTRLRGGVQVSMHGHIRIRKWMPFTAEQIVAPAGYIWAADAGRFPIKISGFDRYSAATGQMSWRLFGAIPVVSATGPDVTRSAAGRLASEIIGLTPGGALSPAITWRGIDDHRAVATVTIDGVEHVVTVTVDDAGILKTISLPRWASPDKGPFRLHTFGVIFDGELTTGGYTLARAISAGWWPDTPRWDQGEFFRATIDRARFF
jgi:Family of unknown function (DUF6544)